MSSEPFDPYYKWLGIPPKDQPADHYRLLGINRYETDQDVIVNAADRVMAHIRSMGTGRYSDQSQKILNEISRAKLVLLNADKKTAYDAELRTKDVVLAPPPPPAGSAVMRAAAVRPQSVPAATGSATLRSVPGAPVQAAAPAADDDSGSYDNVMVDAVPAERASTSSIGRRKPAASGNGVLYAAIAGGLVTVVGLGLFVFGGSGETPRPIAHHDKDKAHKEDKSGKGKSTGSPATTENTPPAATETSPTAAVSTTVPPFGATTESPQPVTTGSTSIPRPSSGGGNWPTLPFDPTAVRPAVDREKMLALRRQVTDLERNRDHAAAVALLDQHEDVVQADATLCRMRAQSLIRLKQLDRAEKDLRRRSELESENPLAVHELITIQLAQGNRADARKTYAAAFEKFEDAAQPQSLVRLGYMAVSMSDPGLPWSKISAVTQKAYDQIRNENPTNGLSWFVTRGHGAVLVRKAAAERNAELARTAIPMFRGSVLAWDMLFLGLAHHTAGSKSASDEQLRQAVDWQRMYAAGRNWQEQIELANIQRDLTENFGLRMDAAGTPPAGNVAMPGGPTPSIPGTPPGTPGTPLPGGLGSLVPPGGAAPEAAAGPLSKKKAVPDAEALKTAKDSVKTLFKDEFTAAKKPEQKIELARRIKAKGDQMGDDANVQYAAYEEALDLSLATNDALLGWAIVESMGDTFDVPLPKLQFEVLQKASTQVKSPVQAKAWCELAEQTLLLATQQDDLDTGSKLGKMAVARAKMVDPGTHKRFVDLSADIEEIKKGFTTVATALETLKTAPDDPAANAQVGRYRCFQKKDWEGGLPHLAKGDDGSLKAAAAKEIVRQTSPKDLVALADLWYAAALERTLPKEKQALMAHANGYYQLALPSLEGYERGVVSKKLEDYIAPLWNRIRLAMKGRKLTTTPLAGTNQFGAAQMDLPHDPRLLTGLRFTSYEFTGGINGRYSVITKITPTYYTPTGSVEGADEGYDGFNVAAKPGYVVGSIAVNCSNEYVHGLQITFVALDGDKLNPRDSYTSPFYGSRTGGTVTLGSNSQPIVSVGQFGSTSYLRGLQLLLSP